MPEIVDLTPTARQMAEILSRVGDHQLGLPTPCDQYNLGELIDHVEGLSLAFAAASRKDLGPITAARRAPDADRLGTDWRTRIPERLDALAVAWADPEAWEGTTRIGGVTMPGSVAGIVALDELVLHAWDICVASGQPFEAGPDTVGACLAVLSQLFPADQLERRQGIFGAPVDVPEDAPLLDRLVGYSGRDPAWSAADRTPVA